MNAIVDMQPVVRLESQIPPDYLGCYCNSGSGWAVAITYPQAETWADANLRLRGYLTYVACHAVRRRDRVLHALWHTIIEPLWRGYVFVHHAKGTSWRPIYETPGIRSLMKHGDQLQYVPAGIVEKFQATEQVRRVLSAERATWEPGAVCTLPNGIDAVVLGQRDGRTLVGILMLGEMREVLVDSDSLVARE